MNRNKKIGLAALLVAAMVLAGFASCSKSNSASASGGNASGGAEAASSAGAAGEGAEAVGSSGKAAPESDFRVLLNDAGDGCIITQYTGKGGNLVIPATIEGLPVLEVQLNPPWDKEIGYSGYNQSLISVVIPEGVTKISDFRHCISLKSVDIPPSVKKIGERAFWGSGLTAVTIYAGVIYDDNDGVYMDGTYSECNALTSVIVQDGVTVLGNYMFANCHNLTTVSIPDSVTEIRGRVFYRCNNLVTVTISPVEGRKWGSGETFKECSKLSLASQAALRKAGYTGRF